MTDTINTAINSKKIDAKLIKLETEIRNAAKSFLIIGKNLTVISDDKLYIERGFTSFEQYMDVMFDYTRDYGIKIRNAYAVYELLKGQKFKVLPVNEGQIRPLTKLDISTEAGKAQIASAWKTVIDTGKRVTAKMVAAAVVNILNPNAGNTDKDSKGNTDTDSPLNGDNDTKTPDTVDKTVVTPDTDEELKLVKARLVQTEQDLIKAKAAIQYDVPRTKLAIELYKAGYKALLQSCDDDTKTELTELYNALVGM